MSSFTSIGDLKVIKMTSVKMEYLACCHDLYTVYPFGELR